MIKRFQDITQELRPLAGSKGGMLAKLHRSNYPVPEGFVIIPTAFIDDTLHEDAISLLSTYLSAIRSRHRGALFAVRQSVISEDNALGSVAEGFVLNVQTDDEVIAAICKVYGSRHSPSVNATHGLDQTNQMAVVVQLMVPSEMSGVLLTADPATGSFASMVGDLVIGRGEQCAYKYNRPKGKYQGPEIGRAHV